jgi:hypothetical protein
MATGNAVLSAYTNTLSPVWGGGYCPNRFPLASWTGDPTIYPIPDCKLRWSEGSEDHKSALVVTLGAGTNRAPESGIRGLLVSSSTRSIVPGFRPTFEHCEVPSGNALSERPGLYSCPSRRAYRFLRLCSRAFILREKLEDVQVGVFGIGGEPARAKTGLEQAKSSMEHA